jgi:hypothetical protein
MSARYSTSYIPWLIFSIITLYLGMSLVNEVQAKSLFTETFPVKLRNLQLSGVILNPGRSRHPK